MWLKFPLHYFILHCVIRLFPVLFPEGLTVSHRSLAFFICRFLCFASQFSTTSYCYTLWILSSLRFCRALVLLCYFGRTIPAFGVSSTLFQLLKTAELVIVERWITMAQLRSLFVSWRLLKPCISENENKLITCWVVLNYSKLLVRKIVGLNVCSHVF